MLKIGDRVKVYSDHYPLENANGEIGKVIKILDKNTPNEQYLIEFDVNIKEKYGFGHDGREYGRGKPNHCYYVWKKEIHVPPTQEELFFINANNFK